MKEAFQRPFLLGKEQHAGTGLIFWGPQPRQRGATCNPLSTEASLDPVSSRSVHEIVLFSSNRPYTKSRPSNTLLANQSVRQLSLFYGKMIAVIRDLAQEKLLMSFMVINPPVNNLVMDYLYQAKRQHSLLLFALYLFISLSLSVYCR